MNKESELYKPLVEYLNHRGFVALRINSGKIKVGRRFIQLAPSGTSDIVGVCLAVEVKKPGEKPTRAQQEFIDRVNMAGGIGLIVESVEDLDTQLNERLKHPNLNSVQGRIKT